MDPRRTAGTLNASRSTPTFWATPWTPAKGANENWRRAFIEAAARRDCPLALQVVEEFYAAATAKLKLDAKDAAARGFKEVKTLKAYDRRAKAFRDHAGKGFL